MGALKKDQPRAQELGIYICGGRDATRATRRMNQGPSPARPAPMAK
jgi:hypothetical protein